MAGWLSNNRHEGRVFRLIGFILIAFGIVLVGSVILLVVYVQLSRNRFTDIVNNGPNATSQIGEVFPESPVRIFRDKNQSDSPELYLGQPIAPQFWDNPLWAHELTDDFANIEFTALDEAFSLGEVSSPPIRVRIPTIALDSDVTGLRILDLENESQYETPKNIVGHIPESSGAGGVGNIWLFGHLESPIRGEGSVFRRLPDIHDILREGRNVFIILDSEDGSFLYQVKEFRKIPEEDLFLWGLPGRWVTLVTCWPRFKYDERVLVVAELVGINLEAGAVSMQ